MTPRKILLAASTLPLLFAIACGGEEPSSGAESSTAATNPAPAPAATTPPDLSNAGAVHGTVSFQGEAPAAQTVQMDADPFCLGAHSGPVDFTPVRVGANGSLQDVVVYVKEGLPNAKWPEPTGNAMIKQDGCMYKPHTLAVRAGQSIVIENDDSTLHNIHAQPSDNPAFNFGQPIQGMKAERSFPNPEVGIPVRCDVHPWMNGFISVFDHPYFAVTPADGSFALDQLPPGDYVVEAWHESLGTQTQNVTVAPLKTVELNFTFGG